ncbi:hypothetical protein ACFQ0M_13900 [Kitasatospora aburaviensis]
MHSTSSTSRTHRTARIGRPGRIAVVAAAGIAAGALAAGCGSSGYSSSSGSGSGAATTAPAAPSSPGNSGTQGGASGTVALQTATDPKLGAIVTDGAGFTVYRFDKDTANPSMSDCNGTCAATWPPVPAGGATVKGIDSKLVGTVTRADSKQLTLNGWPVYRYAPDTKPGDTKGQGVQGTWFALTPTGAKAGAPASSPSGGSMSSTPGGYGAY